MNIIINGENTEINEENITASTNSNWQDSDAKAVSLGTRANGLASEDQAIYNIQWYYTDGSNDPWLIDDNSGTWDDSNFEIGQ